MEQEKFIPMYDDILNLPDLTSSDKIVLSLVYSFTKTGEFHGTNDYISKRTNIPKRSVERIIAKLENLGYIVYHLSNPLCDEKGKIKSNQRQLWTYKDKIPDYAYMSTPPTHERVDPVRINEYHIKQSIDKERLYSLMNTQSRTNGIVCEGFYWKDDKSMKRYYGTTLPKHIDNIINELGMSEDSKVGFKEVIIYYHRKYYEKRNEYHPPYKETDTKRVIENLCIPAFMDETLYWNKHSDCQSINVDLIRECIDFFFDRGIKKHHHDYKMLVFSHHDCLKYILSALMCDPCYIREGADYAI